MSNNPEKDAIRAGERKRQIMEAAFCCFTERSIDQVTMNDVAAAAGVGVATVYRHFASKSMLVLAVSTDAWERYMRGRPGEEALRGRTGAQIFAGFLDAFIDLYRNHRALLRFNQMFNIYVRASAVPAAELTPYKALIDGLAERFHRVYQLGQADGSLRSDIPEAEMFSAALHLMLAAATRFAVGLVYTGGIAPEKELELLRELLIARFTAA